MAERICGTAKLYTVLYAIYEIKRKHFYIDTVSKIFEQVHN